VQAQGIADAMCQSHSGYLENALMLQQQGHTLDTALRMVRGVWQRQPRLAGFLEDSISLAYRDPNGMGNALQSGRWQQVCVQHLMGR
jgi:hypothetical protein